MTIAAAAMNTFYMAVEWALKAAEPFRRPQPPHWYHDRLERDYEWQADHFCPDCRRVRKATFIEWIDSYASPSRQTTAECRYCGFVSEIRFG